MNATNRPCQCSGFGAIRQSRVDVEVESGSGKGNQSNAKDSQTKYQDRSPDTMAPGAVIAIDIGEKCWGKESDCLVESRKESGKTVSADPDRQKWGKRGTQQVVTMRLFLCYSGIGFDQSGLCQFESHHNEYILGIDLPTQSTLLWCNGGHLRRPSGGDENPHLRRRDSLVFSLLLLLSMDRGLFLHTWQSYNPASDRQCNPVLTCCCP